MGAREKPSGHAEIAPQLREMALRGEPDRYLAATLAPHEARGGLAAIAAFAAELARIPATVSEPMLGDMRLQWWRDALEAGRQGTRSGHPVADALADAEQRHGLAPSLLTAMIDARELDLSGGLPADDAGLEAYIQATEGSAFRLALATIGASPDEAEPAAAAAARAYGIARALGRLPMLLHNGGLPLPAARLRVAGLDPDLLGASPLPDSAVAAVAQVAAELGDLARQALAEARGHWRSLAARQRAALLPLAMVGPYFSAQSGRTLIREMADVSPLRRVVRIGWAHATGRL